MTDWDEEALKELNNLDSARLAIRGALATIRDLQDQLVKQKAQVQDEAARRKMAEARMGELNAQLERWQEQAKEWEAAARSCSRGGTSPPAPACRAAFRSVAPPRLVPRAFVGVASP